METKLITDEYLRSLLTNDQIEKYFKEVVTERGKIKLWTRQVTDLQSSQAFKEGIEYYEEMNKKFSSASKSKRPRDPEVPQEALDNFQLYKFPNVFKSIALDGHETKLLSDKGLRRV